jgi:hypothetical protein
LRGDKGEERGGRERGKGRGSKQLTSASWEGKEGIISSMSVLGQDEGARDMELFQCVISGNGPDSDVIELGSRLGQSACDSTWCAV